MLSHPNAEFDILARARWLAEKLSMDNSSDLSDAIKRVNLELVQANPAPDTPTWFAMERLSRETGVKAIRFIQSGQEVPEDTAMAWVSLFLEPNDEDAKNLAKVGLVVANNAWQEAIAKFQTALRRKPKP